jgi:hypothetical protein
VLETGKEKDWKRVPVCSQDSAQSGTPDYPVVHRTVFGGAPDTVRCARLVSDELATLGKTSAVYDYNSSDCPMVHRTVR